MSATQGRQSPPPETQHPSQGTAPTSQNPNEQGAAPSLDHSKIVSEAQKAEKLPSNPGHEAGGAHKLEEVAKEKVSKTT